MKLCKNMNIIEAAEFLEVSERTLRTYAANGRITPTYVRGKTRSVADFALEDLETLKAELGNPAISGKVVNSEKPASTDNSAKPESRKNTETAIVPVSKSANRETLQPQGVAFQVLSQDQFETLSKGQGTTMQELNVKPLLTLAEAAQFTGLSERSLRIGAKDGKLKARRQGRADRILRTDLDKYLIEIQK